MTAANRPPELVGYQVVNGVSVRVRDLTKLGEVLDKSVTLGVNQGGGIEFTNDKPDAVITEARKAAVADAINKARVLAEAAGVSLGRLIELAEQPDRPEPIPVARSMAKEFAADAVPVATGENAYNVTRQRDLRHRAVIGLDAVDPAQRGVSSRGRAPSSGLPATFSRTRGEGISCCRPRLFVAPCDVYGRNTFQPTRPHSRVCFFGAQLHFATARVSDERGILSPTLSISTWGARLALCSSSRAVANRPNSRRSRISSFSPN